MQIDAVWKVVPTDTPVDFPCLWVGSGSVSCVHQPSGLTWGTRPRNSVGSIRYFDDGRFLIDAQGRVFDIVAEEVVRELGGKYKGIAGFFVTTQIVEMLPTVRLRETLTLEGARDLLIRSISQDYIDYLTAHGLDRTRLMERLHRASTIVKLQRAFWFS